MKERPIIFSAPMVRAIRLISRITVPAVTCLSLASRQRPIISGVISPVFPVGKSASFKNTPTLARSHRSPRMVGETSAAYRINASASEYRCPRDCADTVRSSVSLAAAQASASRLVRKDFESRAECH